MSAPQPDKRRSVARVIPLLARLLLGGLFIYLGISNARHGADFLRYVREQLLITNSSLAGLFAATAPWLEVFYGLWLLSGLARETAALVGRWWLGCMFIIMGLHKALPDPGAFLKLVDQYDMVSNTFLLNSIAAALPWFEVYCGLLLLAGVAVRGAALSIAAMLVPFTLVVLKRALVIAAADKLAFCAVKFDCGCGAGEVFICHKLVENTLLLLLSAWLLTGRGRQLCLRFSLLRHGAPAPA
jgi:uncharacterized membrane protein YphA (DoxX/SURF4 family)